MNVTSKYSDTLKKYPFTLSDGELTEKINKILDNGFDKNNCQEVYKKLYSCIDLTTLNATDSREEAAVLGEPGISITRLIEVFSRRPRSEQPQWILEAGPMRLSRIRRTKGERSG